MKNLTVLVFFLCVLSFNKAFAFDGITRNTIVSQKQTRSFYLYVPEKLGHDHPAPLIVMLHGSGRNGNSLVEKWKDLAAKEGLIIVGPDAANPSGWNYPGDGPEFLHDVVESLRTKYSIDPKRIYLFGH